MNANEIGRGIGEGITEGLGWVLIALAFAGVAIVRQASMLPDSPSGHGFTPYKVYTPYFIDESPPGSYDFTLERDGSKSVEIPSPCDGHVIRVWYQGTASGVNGNGGGQIVEVVCGEYVWLFAHLEVPPPVTAGDSVAKGQSIGIQGLTGRTTGHHVHLQIHQNDNGQLGDSLRDSFAYRIVDRSITRPMVENYIQWLRQGQTTKSGSKYEKAIAETLRHEGGCQNSKADSGNYLNGEIGWTCAGITPGTAWRYRSLIGADGFQGKPVEFSKWAYDRNPERFRESAGEILLDYASSGGCDELESPAYEVCADIAFNSGPGKARKYLASASGDDKAVANQLNEQHRADYQKWGGVHLPGWLNRADEREKFINQ